MSVLRQIGIAVVEQGFVMPHSWVVLDAEYLPSSKIRLIYETWLEDDGYLDAVEAHEEYLDDLDDFELDVELDRRGLVYSR